MNHIPPIVVAIWCGVGKPSVLNDYLRPFVTELNDLLGNGLIVNEHRIQISFRCFICDTPARAFIKGLFRLIKAHIFSFNYNQSINDEFQALLIIIIIMPVRNV